MPGEITAALSAGTNRLIRQGAAPLLAADDVLSALGVEPVGPPPALGVSESARRVAALLADGPRASDELVRASGLSPGDAAAALVELELAGFAAEADGVYRPTGRVAVPARG